jgi:tetratricopeptide (TPR) repeat protein
MTEEITTFHERVAAELNERYRDNKLAPDGWRETAVWHWEQAGKYAQAANMALEIAESHVAGLDFVAARQWAERTLELLERLRPAQRRGYELRAYALALAVLEFGGQYREGLEYARRMLRVAQARYGHEAEARALLQVGRMQREVGQLREAEASLLKARDVAERSELSEVETEARVNLAKVHQLQGRHLEALQELRLAQEEPALGEDDMRRARILTSIGDVYRVLGASREAMQFYMQSLNLQHGQASLMSQAILKEKLALGLLGQNKLEEALGNAEESLRIRQDIGDVIGQARANSVIGTIMSRLGQHEQAMSYHERARALDEQTQNQRGQGVALLHLGDAARAMRRYDVAQQHYAEALALAQRSGDQIALARTLERMGDMFLEQGQRDQANRHWANALKIREALGHADEMRALRDRIRSGHLPE